jgi:hypothetical protein
MATNLFGTIKRIQCIEENDFSGSDEPYVLVAAIDMTTFPPGLEVTVFGPWGDMDSGETKDTFPLPPNAPPEVRKSLIDLMSGRMGLRIPFWGLDNKTSKPIAKPDDVIFLASVLERDDGNPKAVRGLVKGMLAATLATSSNVDRRTLVEKLKRDMDSAIQTPAQAPDLGVWSPDDQIGRTLHLNLSQELLNQAAAGEANPKLSFRGDSGDYRVMFKFGPTL